MSLYRVTQTGNGLLIEEYENGRWEIESPDADETYEQEGNRLIKTEVDDDGIDIDIYYDLMATAFSSNQTMTTTIPTTQSAKGTQIPKISTTNSKTQLKIYTNALKT